MAALSLISIKKYKTKLRPRKPLRAIFYAPASPPVFADCKPPTGEIHEEIEGEGRQGNLIYWMLLIEIKKRDLKDVNKRTLFEQNCLISSKRILNVYILLSVAFLFQIFFHPQYTIERIKYLIIASVCRQHIVSYSWNSM